MLDEVFTSCPYCGETISLLVDVSAGDAQYIEDCEVCCRPINVRVWVHEGQPQVDVSHENEI
ncbi:CPXCG motif-containing cysteine-rich protein [Simiduia sp. 21SJ11W-1]|uniref:CPXCG motif-containing cysteine-rich protein n=1 Tax=Simiduia sp. 21SJ11W-1 TaxID=2909669 RepID=UPI00209D3E11|nr:CPXCG motif-containing cysteine-rich protein [Simiduia sp. 21SJ11W-1]UTA47829.1 CPXCG motif-containing cysteine-rich protein [Simiduia sp. 21SJ11W-1]